MHFGCLFLFNLTREYFTLGDQIVFVAIKSLSSWRILRSVALFPFADASLRGLLQTRNKPKFGEYCTALR